MDLNNLIELKRKLEELCEDQGFLYLNQMMQIQVDELQKDILYSRCVTIDSLLPQEYKKGQLEGRLAWKAALDGILETLSLDIDNLKENEDEHSESN